MFSFFIPMGKKKNSAIHAYQTKVLSFKLIGPPGTDSCAQENTLVLIGLGMGHLSQSPMGLGLTAQRTWLLHCGEGMNGRVKRASHIILPAIIFFHAQLKLLINFFYSISDINSIKGNLFSIKFLSQTFKDGFTFSKT